MRTREQEQARFTYLKTADVAQELNVARSHVADMARTGVFPDLPDGTRGVIDVGLGERPEYRIHPESFAMYKRGERAEAA